MSRREVDPISRDMLQVKAVETLDVFLDQLERCTPENQPSGDLVRGTIDALKFLEKAKKESQAQKALEDRSLIV